MINKVYVMVAYLYTNNVTRCIQRLSRYHHKLHALIIYPKSVPITELSDLKERF